MLCLIYVKENILMYERQGFNHNYPTRIANKIKISYTRLQHCRYSKNYFGPLFYNKLPERLKNLKMVEFKTKIKSYLIEKAFYSISEFLDSDVENVE
jgi:hypothetical protein